MSNSEEVKRRVGLMERYLKKPLPSVEEQLFEQGRFPHNDIIDKFYIPLCVLNVSLTELSPFSVLGIGWVYQWYEEMEWDVELNVKTFIEDFSRDEDIPKPIRDLLKSMLKKIDEHDG